MYRSVTAVAMAFSFAACTTPAPPIVADTGNPAATANRTGEPVPSEEEAGSRDIEVVDLPDAPEGAVAPEPRPGGPPRICRNEKRTGTNRVVRVCRSAAQIERDVIEGKEAFEELRRSQQQR